MKRLSSLALVLVALTVLAVAPTVTPKEVSFQWRPNPLDLGGMTTNQYYTNIVFNVLSVTDCTIATNLWPIVTNWTASTFPSVDGVNWTNTVTIDGATRFYLIQASNKNGGSAPFSSVATWVPSPPQGFNPKVYGP